MIEVSELAVDRGDRRVIEDVSLSVAAGEFVGLVGPNGAGKTTLLHTINGVLEPATGQVTIDDRSIPACGAREVARLAATVSQDTTVDFAFTVEQLVEMGRTPYHRRIGRSDRDGHEAVQRALDRTDTAGFADRTFGQLSGGQKQRVLLARALAQETPVLLLDEPTASLDIDHERRTLELVADVVADGRATLAAIHDLDLAARFCDRLVLLSEGRILASGPPADVLDAATVGETYDTTAAVTTDPVTGTPSVRALGDRPDRDEQVHLLGGGLLGARVLAHLHGAGLDVTVGPLPAGDVTAEAARARDAEPIEAPPFADPDPAVCERVRTAVANAGVTVVVPTDGVDPARYVRSGPVVVVSDESGIGTGEDAGTQKAVGAIEERVITTPDSVVRAVLNTSPAVRPKTSE